MSFAAMAAVVLVFLGVSLVDCPQNPKTPKPHSSAGHVKTAREYKINKKANINAKMEKIIGEKFLSAEGDVSTEAILKDAQFVCVYFSAHWCPPCRGFTPVLKEVY